MMGELLSLGSQGSTLDMLLFVPAIVTALFTFTSGVLLLSTGRAISAHAYMGRRATPEEYLRREIERLRTVIASISVAMISIGLHAFLDIYISYRLEAAAQAAYPQLVMAKWLSLASLTLAAVLVVWALLLIVDKPGLRAPLLAYSALAMLASTYILLAQEPSPRSFSLSSAVSSIAVAVPFFLASGSLLFMGGMKSGITGFKVIGAASILVGAMNIFYPLVDLATMAHTSLWYIFGGAIPAVLFLAGSLILMRSRDWIHAIIYLGLTGDLS